MLMKGVLSLASGADPHHQKFAEVKHGILAKNIHIIHFIDGRYTAFGRLRAVRV
jgi:hypothetical protein